MNEGEYMLTRRNVMTTIFLATSVMSIVFLIISTLTYIEFYRAIETLDLRVLDISPSIGQNTVAIGLDFVIMNPTSYADLKIREIGFALHYTLANGTLIGLYWFTSTYYKQPTPLNGYSNVTFEYSINLDVHSSSTERFIEFYEEQQGNINWVLKCNALLITFAENMNVQLEASFFSHQ